MSKPMNFQQIMLTLQQYWAEYGCTLWQPYHEVVGAGTANPATSLRVLSAEPWNVAYVEPSFRPDDGRFGENPNRMQMHHQFQVILKPDPGNPQELYLKSLEAIGLNLQEHDVRFVEDNWESPALGAWGLGWEVWIDGMEISQYTYFQQAGGVTLDPPAVELTYGLERIAMYLQDVDVVWDLDWDGKQSYGDILLRQEVEFCSYEFMVADIDGLTAQYDFCEAEANRCLGNGLVIPAHDYVLKCSHIFNLLDTRGAVGVTERAAYFGRMRRLSQRVAREFVQQREDLGYPLMRYMPDYHFAITTSPMPDPLDAPAEFVLEIGSEELPSHHVPIVVNYLNKEAPALLDTLRLSYDDIYVSGTPRRQTLIVRGLAPQQEDLTEELRGPSAKIAFDAEGQPTKAALGFARGRGVAVEDLLRKDVDGTEYVFAKRHTPGRPAAEVLAESLPDFIKGINVGRSMRWLASEQVGQDVAGISYSRPIRWLVALLGNNVVPFTYAGVNSGRVSRGLRPEGSPSIEIESATSYQQQIKDSRIILDIEERQNTIQAQLNEIAASLNGTPLDDPALLEEVTHLVEQPTAFRGDFDESHLELPDPVLITVMKKHQRYFPVFGADGQLLPHFIGVRNGNDAHIDKIKAGNERVIVARYSDANFFYQNDTQKSLEDFLPRLDTLTFQTELGSMLDKTHRVEKLAPQIGDMLNLTEDEQATLSRAATLFKADLATEMVVELTSLQGQMGYEYALRSNESEAVAIAIKEHYMPASADDGLPETAPGLALGIANRLDSLMGLTGVGLLPSGNKDPFALRREALGLVTILLQKGIDFKINLGLYKSAMLLPISVSTEQISETSDFIQRRLEGILRDEYGLAHDVVQAVLAERGDNPALALSAAQELSTAVAADDWDTILTAFARCVRIVRDLDRAYPVEEDLFVEPAEEALYAAYQQAKSQLDNTASLSEVIAAIRQHLVGPINTFFDEVLVMSDKAVEKYNRLGLLQNIRDLSKGYADFSELQGF